MPIEDFTTYTEEDPNDHIGLVGTNHVDFTAYRNEDAYLYKDYGENHFGDFTHDIDVYCDTRSGVNPIAGVWALTNDVDDLKGIKDAGGTAICVQFYRKSDGTLVLRLREIYDFTNYVDDYVASYDTWYYLVIEKNGTSLTCKIYSDSDRTNLLDTLSLTLHGDWQFQYVFSAITNNTGSTDYFIVDIENLDLNEEGAIVKEVTDSLSLSDSVLVNKNLQVSDSLNLSDNVLRDKPLTEVSDSLNLSDSVKVNKTLTIEDVLSLSEQVDVTSAEIIKEVIDSLTLSDLIKVGKNIQISDSLTLADLILLVGVEMKLDKSKLDKKKLDKDKIGK